VFRTIMGFTKGEFAQCTKLAGEPLGIKDLSQGKIDSLESGTEAIDLDQVRLLAITLTKIIDGSLFGEPVGELRRKQHKPDTAEGWLSVQKAKPADSGGRPRDSVDRTEPLPAPADVHGHQRNSRRWTHNPPVARSPVRTRRSPPSGSSPLPRRGWPITTYSRARLADHHLLKVCTDLPELAGPPRRRRHRLDLRRRRP